MSDENEKTITFTLPASEAIGVHIEGLQATLTKRNRVIERLTAQLEEAQRGEPSQAALSKAYRRGWQECSHHLTNSTAIAAQALGKVRKDAFEIYLKAERGEFDAPEEASK